MITIQVNGASRQINIEPDTPLLWVLRDVIGLTGTKFGCGIAQCGACTVHINGTAMRSCSVPIGALDGAQIVTIEGLSSDNNHPVQRAWIEEGVPQCGYCQSGQIMAVVAFLKNYAKPTDADIDANITNICRCGTYEPLRRAIHRAADMMKASRGRDACRFNRQPSPFHSRGHVRRRRLVGRHCRCSGQGSRRDHLETTLERQRLCAARHGRMDRHRSG